VQRVDLVINLYFILEVSYCIASSWALGNIVSGLSCQLSLKQVATAHLADSMKDMTIEQTLRIDNRNVTTSTADQIKSELFISQKMILWRPLSCNIVFW